MAIPIYSAKLTASAIFYATSDAIESDFDSDMVALIGDPHETGAEGLYDVTGWADGFRPDIHHGMHPSRNDVSPVWEYYGDDLDRSAVTELADWLIDNFGMVEHFDSNTIHGVGETDPTPDTIEMDHRLYVTTTDGNVEALVLFACRVADRHLRRSGRGRFII